MSECQCVCVCSKQLKMAHTVFFSIMDLCDKAIEQDVTGLLRL